MREWESRCLRVPYAVWGKLLTSSPYLNCKKGLLHFLLSRVPGFTLSGLPALITVCVYKSAQVLYASYLLPVIIRLYTHATIVQITDPNDQTAFIVTQTTFLLVTSRANYTISRFPINPIRLALNKLQPSMTPVHSCDYVTDA